MREYRKETAAASASRRIIVISPSIPTVRPSDADTYMHAYKGKRIVAVISCLPRSLSLSPSLSPSPSLTLYDAECGNADDD